jgi:hypothetical protein
MFPLREPRYDSWPGFTGSWTFVMPTSLRPSRSSRPRRSTAAGTLSRASEGFVAGGFGVLLGPALGWMDAPIADRDVALPQPSITCTQ